eukprot:NODE_9134_length_381_cov_30.804217_g8234_i0.p1 GENE.NODE_9134_length_381_cov_30.804217_g8234_i0~~NODE_9134_length_381_cov_30.804217_g8234_i0.p1  ORF type:complete len:107 (+),score=18.52 NODE_9134_length_381_cov_30.804217_g8234_i0:39-359(+)
MVKSGIFVGLNHGTPVNKPETHPRNNRMAHKKGRLHKRVKLVREVVKEISGLAPYEKAMVEMIKTGVPAREKKALKLARKRLGAHKRSHAKRDELTTWIQHQKRNK